MSPKHRSWLVKALFVFGTVQIVAVAVIALQSWSFQRNALEQLRGLDPPKSPELRNATGAREAALAGDAIGEFSVRRLRLSAAIVEGTKGKALRRGVGHVENTAFPGELGNMGLAAHRDTYFRKLKDIARGDTVYVRTRDGEFVYLVDMIMIVSPERSDLLSDTGEPLLTMVTCYPFWGIGPAPERFVVQARLLGKPVHVIESGRSAG